MVKKAWKNQKKMKAKEIRSSDKNTLNEKILELKKELVKLNAQVAIGASLKNPGQVKKIKKTVARILTVEQERIKGKPEKIDKIKKSEADKKA